MIIKEQFQEDTFEILIVYSSISLICLANEQARSAVRNEDKSFRAAKKFSKWRMCVGAVLGAGSERGAT